MYTQLHLHGPLNSEICDGEADCQDGKTELVYDRLTNAKMWQTSQPTMLQCTKQVDGAQRRSMVHNVALYHCCSAQHRLHKHTHTCARAQTCSFTRTYTHYHSHCCSIHFRCTATACQNTGSSPTCSCSIGWR